ncbi:unnamed protein product [Prunus brigantina]
MLQQPAESSSSFKSKNRDQREEEEEEEEEENTTRQGITRVSEGGDTEVSFLF